MRKNIIAVIGYIFMTMPAMAWHSWISDAILKNWGGRANFSGCGITKTQGCIGKKLREKNCSAYDAQLKMGNRWECGGDKRVYGYTFMLAREVNEHGAYFCPTTLYNHCGISTNFSEPLGNRTCVWLCMEGWTGDRCETSVADYKGACDIVPFLRTNYDDVLPDPGAVDMEWNFLYVRADSRYTCKARNGRDTTPEHDIVIAIDRFLDSGNGAIARMMEVNGQQVPVSRYGHDGHSDMRIYPASASAEHLLCKRGYKPNAARTDCEPINPAECNQAIMSQKMCSGWDLSQFDENIHVAELVGGCYKYKCKQANYTFASVSDHKCIECAKGLRGGPHPNDGTCVKCDAGFVFNAEDATNNYCSKAIGLTHVDLTWGKGKTKGDYKTSTDVKQQCWTKVSPDEYRDCILGTNK